MSTFLLQNNIPLPWRLWSWLGPLKVDPDSQAMIVLILSQQND